MSSHTAEEKTLKTIKEEFLNSLKESEDVDERSLNEMATSIKNPNGVMRVIKQYEEILKIKNIKL